jgi:cytochrome c
MSMTKMGLCASLLASVALAGCGGGADEPAPADTGTAAATTATAATTPTAAPAAAAPAADDVATLDGSTFAAFTGNADKGKVVFLQCKTCHVREEGVNRIGPSLAGIVGRAAGTVAGYDYTPANKNSGITWTPEKLFQYLENPQRVIPGTKMAFAGLPKPQDRADVIAYLQSDLP